MCQGCKGYKYFQYYLAKNIRNARQKRGFTQETFAFKLQSSPKYIGCIERAEKTPSLNFLYRIAKILDTTIECLCENTMNNLDT